MDNNTAVTSFSHNQSSRHLKSVILDFIESLENCVQLSYYQPELIQRLTKSKHTKKKICTNKDKKLIWNLEMHNWSSIHPTNMIFNFL